MKKILKYSLVLMVFIIITILYILISPRIYHYDCYKAGGKWVGFSNTKADWCDADFGATIFAEGCDCGEDKCWNGQECIADLGEND